MNGHTPRLLGFTIATLLASGVQADPSVALLTPRAPSSQPPARNAGRTSKPAHPPYVAPNVDAVEPASTTRAATATMDRAGVFSAGNTAQAVTPSSTTLSPPVSIVYSGSSPAINVATTGTSKAVQASINNPANTSSALYGQTNGAGGGVTGYNGGTTGFAGKFGITNNASKQPAVLASTTGTGPALLATNSNTASYGPAISAKSANGTGIEAESPSYYAVSASTQMGIGVSGVATQGIGLFGHSDSYVGVNAESDSSIGLDAFSKSGIAMRATGAESYAVVANSGGLDPAVYVNNNGKGDGIEAHSATANAITGTSPDYIGVGGYSTSSAGLFGFSTNGYGVFGSSTNGYAGYFNGKVAATSYQTLSDRNSKTHFEPVDGKDILARVNRLPVTTWDFKTDPGKKHLGPMAQDFHAAFGLDGTDDKHINLTDIAGVSLAAIQELSRQMKTRDAQIQDDRAQLRKKDARIAALDARLEALSKTLESRLTALEQRNTGSQRSATARAAITMEPATL